MYILWNSFKNLGRNKGRNILIAVIILVLVVSAAICLVINTTTGSIISDYKTRFGAEVSIDRDYEKILKTGQKEVLDPTNRQLVSFGESDYLQKVEYAGVVWGTLTDLKSPFGGKMDGKPSVYLNGNSLSNINETFGQTNKLVDGQMYEKTGDCLVEKEFAQLNNLSIGDSFSVDVLQDGYGGSKTKRCTLTITGLFENYAYLDGSDWSREQDPVTILVHTDTMVDMEMIDLDMRDYLFAKFYLKEPGMLEAFTQELRSKGLTDDMKVVADEAGYQKVIGPVEGLAGISMTFLVVVLILGCAILLVISVLGIRERKYEIGVLRAMGMEKGKVGLGFFCESLTITLLCLIVGLGIGMVLSQPVADALLKEQIAAAQAGMASGVESIIDQNSNLTPLSTLAVQFELSSILGIGIIALIIVLVSSIASILYVTRYEPMRILSERN